MTLCGKKDVAPAGYAPTIELSHITAEGNFVFQTCNSGIKKEIPMTPDQVEQEAGAIEARLAADTMARPFSAEPYDLAVYRYALRCIPH